MLAGQGVGQFVGDDGRVVEDYQQAQSQHHRARGGNQGEASPVQGQQEGGQPGQGYSGRQQLDRAHEEQPQPAPVEPFHLGVEVRDGPLPAGEGLDEFDRPGHGLSRLQPGLQALVEAGRVLGQEPGLQQLPHQGPQPGERQGAVLPEVFGQDLLHRSLPVDQQKEEQVPGAELDVPRSPGRLQHVVLLVAAVGEGGLLVSRPQPGPAPGEIQPGLELAPESAAGLPGRVIPAVHLSFPPAAGASGKDRALGRNLPPVRAPGTGWNARRPPSCGRSWMKCQGPGRRPVSPCPSSDGESRRPGSPAW